MLHLYVAAFGAVVAANMLTVAIAATIKRDRYWPLWLWPNGAEAKKPPLKMALKRPIVGYWRSLGCTSLFCVRGISHDTEATRNSCRRA
jgi:hypothetical protein